MERMVSIIKEYQDILNTYDGSKETFANALEKIIKVHAKTEALITVCDKQEVLFVARLTLAEIEKERKYVNGIVNGRGRKTRFSDIQRYHSKVEEFASEYKQ